MSGKQNYGNQAAERQKDGRNKGGDGGNAADQAGSKNDGTDKSNPGSVKNAGANNNGR